MGLSTKDRTDGHPDIVRDQEVLELGAGTGLLSLVAGRIGCRKAVASDLDDRILDRLNAAITSSE